MKTIIMSKILAVIIILLVLTNFNPPQYTVNHPIFNSQNELLNFSNKLMEQMTTLCDLVGQAIQKKEEEKRIAEEQASKDQYWKIPICYDDDEDKHRCNQHPFLPMRITITRSDLNHEEFADELAHIISPPEYDHFCFKIEPELGNLTMDVVE
ncbi:hypothetical protein Tco_0281883 [Tanacetum coccineum]